MPTTKAQPNTSNPVTTVPNQTALVMMAVTLIVTVYTVVVYLSGSPVEGWTTTMLFLGFGFFGMFAILAMVLKYLSILVDLTFKRQKYVFESIEKISK